uniref:Putative secreted protein n=1 Tax=Anopheles darlingi TaxID=43151 RepID=A0A2M4D6K0_ANODA
MLNGRKCGMFLRTRSIRIVRSFSLLIPFVLMMLLRSCLAVGESPRSVRIWASVAVSRNRLGSKRFGSAQYFSLVFSS